MGRTSSASDTEEPPQQPLDIHSGSEDDSAGASASASDKLTEALRAIYEQKNGDAADFKLSLGERMMLMEQLERDGLTELDSPTAMKQAYRFLMELRSLQQNFGKKKFKRHLRATQKKSFRHGHSTSLTSIASAVSYDNLDTVSISSTTSISSAKSMISISSIASTSSSTSKSSLMRRPRFVTKAKESFENWRSMRYGVEQANPLDDSGSEDDEDKATSPETAAYFSSRSKKKLTTAGSDTFGAIAALATQVNIPTSVRAIHGQLRTNAHIGHLRGIQRDIKTREYELLTSGTASEEQLLRYEDLVYICTQIISIKTAKSIDQGGTAASALIPSIISAASKVVGGATKAVSAIYHRDPHVTAVLAQKLHAHAHSEIRTLNASEEGCEVETPGFAIVCELLSRLNDPRPPIIQQKSSTPSTNERVRLAETICLEPRGWNVIMDKLTLK